MKYTIQKIFGSYSICVENDYTTMTYYDVQKDIIDIINQLEQERNNYKELYEKENKNWNELKEWLEEENKKTFIDIVSISAYQKVLSKMQEIEKGYTR